MIEKITGSLVKTTILTSMLQHEAKNKKNLEATSSELMAISKLKWIPSSEIHYLEAVKLVALRKSGKELFVQLTEKGREAARLIISFESLFLNNK